MRLRIGLLSLGLLLQGFSYAGAAEPPVLGFESISSTDENLKIEVMPNTLLELRMIGDFSRDMDPKSVVKAAVEAGEVGEVLAFVTGLPKAGPLLTGQSSVSVLFKPKKSGTVKVTPILRDGKKGKPANFEIVVTKE